MVAPPAGPVLTVTKPWTSRDFSASRVVPLLTPNRACSSLSFGSLSPGISRFSAIQRLISSTIRSLRFLKHAAPLQGEAGTLRSIIYIGDAVAPAGLVGYEALIEAHSPLPDAGKGGEDLAGIFYTGGTTGFPKGVDAVAPQSMVECDGMARRRRTERAEGHA